MQDYHTNKNLGQHWLKDAATLEKIASYADLTTDDTVLEIGPGLGTLTNVLAARAGRVVAVEFDRELAENLTNSCNNSCKNGAYKNVEVINADFLQFDLSQMPKNYKIVANIPYYITNKIVMKLLEAPNKPSVAVLLVQKEVAERLAADVGDMSILSVAAQFYADVKLGQVVPANMFTPPPKVDSQVVILTPHNKHRSCSNRGARTVLMENVDEKEFFSIVKAGFSERRKKLRSSLAGGLGISKTEAEKLLADAGIDANLRAQDLALKDWHNLSKIYKTTNNFQ
jgi:16S rRNA (adenine1518-N6/adenine1519-N6)-dimethyltransferase